MQQLLAAIQVLDKLRNTPVVLELRVLRFAGLRISRPLVRQRDLQTLVQECELAQPLRQRVVVVLRSRENGSVRNEVNLRPTLLRRSSLLQLAGRFARGISLLPGRTIAPDFQLQLFAKRIHAGHTHAVQSARNFVARRIKFPAGMQLGHHHFRRRYFLAINLHVVHGNAAPVVDHGNGVVDMNRNFNLRREPGQRLVNGVVDNLVHEMMQPHLARRPDIHGRTFAHRLHAAEHFDGVGRVVAVASVRGADRSHFSVFCFGFYDGSVDLFSGHSAPRKLPNSILTYVPLTP